MTLKLAENYLSFGLNGSHKARKFLSAKGPGFCPPPGTSKTNGDKNLQPIMTANARLTEVKWPSCKDLGNRTFSKFPGGQNILCITGITPAQSHHARLAPGVSGRDTA